MLDTTLTQPPSNSTWVGKILAKWLIPTCPNMKYSCQMIMIPYKADLYGTMQKQAQRDGFWRPVSQVAEPLIVQASMGLLQQSSVPRATSVITYDRPDRLHTSSFKWGPLLFVVGCSSVASRGADVLTCRECQHNLSVTTEQQESLIQHCFGKCKVNPNINFKQVFSFHAALTSP